MKDTFSDTVVYYLRDPLISVLIGIGITISWSQFLGGLILAMAGTAIAFKRREKTPKTKDSYQFLSAMFSGVFVSIGVAILWSSLPANFSSVPPQFGMMLSGFLSAEILTLIKSKAKKIEENVDDTIPGI